MLDCRLPLKPCPNTTRCLKVMEIYREIHMHYLVVEPTHGMHLIWKLFWLRRELYSARVRACIYLNEGSYCQCHFVNIYETQTTKPNVLYRAKTIHKNEKRKGETKGKGISSRSLERRNGGNSRDGRQRERERAQQSKFRRRTRLFTLRSNQRQSYKRSATHG